MLAVYTCFFGSDANWTANYIPETLPDIDSYYFTNNPNMYARLAATKWKRVWVDIPISEDLLVSSEQTKHLRCCSHAYLELASYPYLCWIDSKLRFTSKQDVMSLLTELILSDKVWVFTHHPLPYTDVWGEYNEAIKHKYVKQKDQYKAYIESRIEMGYNEHIPQRTCCGFHVRKNCPLVREIGEFWYREIQKCGAEDQISFQFVHQRYEDAILLVEYQTAWRYI